jgi:hypothetical protein
MEERILIARRKLPPWDKYRAYTVDTRDTVANIPELPVFNEWNKGSNHLFYACYDFFCNGLMPESADVRPGQYTVFGSHPGFSSGNPMRALTIEEVRKAVISDGAHYVSDDPALRVIPPKSHFLGAGFLTKVNEEIKKVRWEFLDYHFLRKEGELWYQKAGRRPVTNLNELGQPITDLKQAFVTPDFASLGFVGYFLVPNKGIELDLIIQRHEPQPPRPKSGARGNSYDM